VATYISETYLDGGRSVENDKAQWPPHAEEGWIIDKRVLHTIFALKGLQKGDQLLYTSLMRPQPVELCVVENGDHSERLCTHYGNPEVAVEGMWSILAWRRPQ
jgi:hypothetical protein